MDLGILEQKEIQGYFKLDKRIKAKEKRIKTLRDSFYDQSMATRVTSDGLEVISMGFSTERNVIPLVDALVHMEKTIQIFCKKRRYLNDYLNLLPLLERRSLVKRYAGDDLPIETDPSDTDLYAEILEIEDAINFQYGYPLEIRADTLEITKGSYESNINSIAELLGV